MKQSAHDRLAEEVTFEYAGTCWTSASGAYIAVRPSIDDARLAPLFLATNASTAACVCTTFNNLALTCEQDLSSNSAQQSGAASVPSQRDHNLSVASIVGIVVGCAVAVAAAAIFIKKRRRDRERQQRKMQIEYDPLLRPSNPLSTFHDIDSMKQPPLCKPRSVTNPMYAIKHEETNLHVNPLHNDEEDSESGMRDVFVDMVEGALLSDEALRVAEEILVVFEGASASSATQASDDPAVWAQLAGQMATLERLAAQEDGGVSRAFRDRLVSLKAAVERAEERRQLRRVEPRAVAAVDDVDARARANIARVMARLKRVRRASLVATATTTVTVRAKMRWDLLRRAYEDGKLVPTL
jgi:hypothetical protein